MDYNKALGALLKMRAEMTKEYDTHGIKYEVLTDALDHEEEGTTESTGEVVDYLTDVCKHGCQSGIVSGLIYYHDTKAFYIKHIDEIDEMRQEMEDSIGEPLKIGTPMYNWLAWFAYEETARKILDEIGVEI